MFVLKLKSHNLAQNFHGFQQHAMKSCLQQIGNRHAEHGLLTISWL